MVRGVVLPLTMVVPVIAAAIAVVKRKTIGERSS
jgi:hypothetical protein